MLEREQAEIIDFTELSQLLDWIKAAQMFVEAGSGELLSEKLMKTIGNKFPQAPKEMQQFSDAYSFNHVAMMSSLAKSFNSCYNQKALIKESKKLAPALSLIYPFIDKFIKSCINQSNAKMQLDLIHRNFKNGHYARSIIILREFYITLFAEAFKLRSNEYRQKIENNAINLVAIKKNKDAKFKLSHQDKEREKRVYSYLISIFPQNAIDDIIEQWNAIRPLRNISSHIKTIQDKHDYGDLKKELENYIDRAENHLNELLPFFEKARGQSKIFKELIDSNKLAPEKFFLIVNEGMHPILDDLKRQYGTSIRYAVLSAGNISLNDEQQIAIKCKEIVEQNPGVEYLIVPSGLPYIITTVYNTIFQVTSNHPIFLQFDRDTNTYEEKNLDPRRIILD